MQSIRLKFSFANPLILYVVIWSSTLLLYSIEITKNIKGLNSSTECLINFSILIYILINIIIQLFRSRNKYSIREKVLINFNNDLHRFNAIINKIFTIWLIFSLFEIVLFNGVPLISVVVLGQLEKDYSKFGLPTLHGLLNALYYTYMVGTFIMYLITKRKKYLYRVLIFISWPILLMSRASFLWVLSELLCAFLLLNKISTRKLLIIFSGVILFIYLFGVIGDARIGENSNFKTSNFVSEKYENIAESIPTGFVWVYLYATTPINNIVTQTDQIKPKYDFKYTTLGLIPSFIRSRIYTDDDKYGFVLEDEAFNVSSFFSNFLNDFGVLGALIVVSFIFLGSLNLYYLCFTGKVGYLISYSVIFYATLTSIFFDNFFSLVTIFQILLGVFINYMLYNKRETYV